MLLGIYEESFNIFEKTQDFCHRYNAVKKQQYQMNDLYN
jgi:hypothetical protein